MRSENSSFSVGKFPFAIFLACSFPARPISAAFGFNLDGSLDKRAISEAYFEGEFKQVIPPLEAYRRNFPENAVREDSIFTFKYLGVVYASDPATRAEAESCLEQLTKVDPEASLIDLYVSDQILAFFDEVKRTSPAHQRKAPKAVVRADPPPGIAIASPGSTKRKRLWAWWTLGGIGTAAVATTAYYTLHDDGKRKEERISITPR